MGRKRSTGQEVYMKEQRRRRLEKKRRLTGVMVCPRCDMEEVVLNIQKGRFTHIIQDGKYGPRYVKCKIGRVLCKNCGLSVTAGLLPGEVLVDLYCWMYDREKDRQWEELVSGAISWLLDPVDQG